MTGITEGAKLKRFVAESNRIEGIHREPTEQELDAHAVFLALRRVKRSDMENFVRCIVGAPLRDRKGMNVRVGPHRPPPGHPEMAIWLDDLLEAAFIGAAGPWEIHRRYESLHPFMDGNGRSGRALWAWMCLRKGLEPFARDFLHSAYYEALESGRSTEGIN